MVTLKIFNEDKNGSKDSRPVSETMFNTLNEAIYFGQGTGSYYEVVDLTTGRVVDWNEVNYKNEDDWYYDEAEMIWKKRSREEKDGQRKTIFDWLFGSNNESCSCLSY